MTAQPTSISERFRLDGKRALVTGAGRGIGLGAARAFAEMGAEVTLVARSADEIEAAADEIRQSGGKADTLAVDVMDLDRILPAIAERQPYQILFNNAGINRTNTFVDVKIEDFDYIFGLNVRAAFFVAQAVARKLVAAGEKGSIINVSSQMGHVGAATRSVYCASKWAMEGMTRAMAIDLAPQGIRVNTICPTFVETKLANNYLGNPEFRTYVESKIKLGRVGQVDDLIGAIVLLASDASSLMTGSSIVIDGGWTAD
ncbi:MAG: SDR family oxidoreductase [Bauldia sp.]|nr:SDR family oxidoreductase [Bauldia sp.]